ncbi:translocation/assembly module TamB domain-containing protein [Consotaella aegiceratis]|uniref:translocation/assembly module TamB domain-containing protein n=1 Tax=Consotaella aegiceratis TaxID=3097961 RepID=UPI002F412B62
MRPLRTPGSFRFWRCGVLAVAVMAAAAGAPRAVQAQEFVANQIENLLSSDTMKVEIEGLSGALSGSVRIDSVTVSDPAGVFLTAKDLAMDWSPLSLVRANVNIESLKAGQITLERLPQSAPTDDTEESGGFSLPSITADVKEIAIDEFDLGEAVAGVPARLKATANLVLDDDPTKLDFGADIERLDAPGQITAKVAFAPDQNQLDIQVNASEPAGGLVARLLKLPGAPPVELTVQSSGPLNDFTATGQLQVDGEQAANLSARVTDQAEGRRITGTLDVEAERFVPVEYAALAAGGAHLDVSLLQATNGVLTIDKADLSSDALHLAASGTYDSAGDQTDLSVTVEGSDGSTLPLGFGSGDGRVELEIASAQARLAGALTAATLSVEADLPAAGYGSYRGEGVQATVSSDGFNLNAMTGPFVVDAHAETTEMPEGVTQRFLAGPVDISATGSLEENRVVLDQSEVTTSVAKASAKGSAALDLSTFDVDLSSTFETVAISPQVVDIAGYRLAVSGHVVRNAEGSLTAENLAVRGEGLAIDGSAGLHDDTVEANVTGSLDQAAALTSALGGTARFKLTADGPSSAPQVELTLDADGLTVEGRTLTDIRLEARGTANPTAPSGTLDLSGALDGQPLTASADVKTLSNGEIEVSDLALRQGPNTVSGDLRLTQAYIPLGSLTLDIQDLAPLASLALQEASGDLAGGAELSLGPNGEPVADVDLNSQSLSVAGTSLSQVRIDLALDDYLEQPSIGGSVQAAAVDTGGIAVRNLDADLQSRSDGTAIDARATANGVPVDLAGSVAFADGATTVTLDRLNAAIENAAIALAQAPATVTIRNGTTSLERLALAVGNGSIILAGSAGETLDLSLDLDAVPAAVANPFVPDLEASGTISGHATVSGAASDPQVVFSAEGDDLASRQTRAAHLDPLQARFEGSYAALTLSLKTATVDLGSGSIDAVGTVGDTLDLDLKLVQVPVALANDFVPGLEASGTISGEGTATGTLSDPSVVFDLSGSGITAAQVSRAGIAPIEMQLSGRYEKGTATIEAAQARVGDGSLQATGTVGRALDLQLSLNRIPVGLANGFVPDLDASGTVSGTATATGSLSNPTAEFDVRGEGIATSQTRTAGAPPIDFSAAGRYADGTVTVRSGSANVGGGTITVTGSAGQSFDLTVRLDNIPAALAGAAAPDVAPTGTISGTAHVTGTAAAPNADYDLRVTGLTLAQTRAAGVGPMAVSAAGRFADNVVSLDADLSGAGIAFRASGSVNIAGTPELDLSLNGTAPLSLANRILAEGSRAVQGTVTVDARITGSTAAPNVVGTVSTSNASFVDTGVNVSVTGINTRISLNGQTATIDRFTARSGRDGTIRIGGTIGLSDGFPADLQIAMENGDYNDGRIVAADFTARLTLTGPLTGSPLLEGTVNASTISVLVPENLPTSLARLDVTHRNASPEVYEQARKIQPERSSAGSSSGVQLDVTLTAENRVFVRGRGLDVELGGTIRLYGPVSDPQIVGAFDLQRGRFRILSRRLDFQRGTLTFTGGLLPTLDLVATSDTGEATVNVAVTGPASDPSFNFSSSPTLPQDEVLARLVFGQATADLSPLQIAQLAEAAATLAGVGGSTGLLGNLRAQLGVDDLDLKTTEDGQTAVGVGKYLNDRTYLSVDTTGRVAVDLDLGRGLKARGAVGADGGGEVGVFYEKEY